MQCTETGSVQRLGHLAVYRDWATWQCTETGPPGSVQRLGHLAVYRDWATWQCTETGSVQRLGHLAVGRAGEEEDVQESGVGEATQSTDALQRQLLQVSVHAHVVSVQCRVPVYGEEFHAAPGIPLLGGLPRKPVGAQHQLRHLPEVVHCTHGERGRQCCE